MLLLVLVLLLLLFLLVLVMVVMATTNTTGARSLCVCVCCASASSPPTASSKEPTKGVLLQSPQQMSRLPLLARWRRLCVRVRVRVLLPCHGLL